MELSFCPALPQDAQVIFSFARELIEAYEDPKEMDLDRALAWTRRKIETGIHQYTRIVLDGETVGFFRFAPCEEGMELDDLYILPPSGAGESEPGSSPTASPKTSPLNCTSSRKIPEPSGFTAAWALNCGSR